MAELIFPDFGAKFQQGYQSGTQNRLLREGEQKQSALASLAGQAYGATGEQRRGLIGQAVGIDREAGFALEKDIGSSDDARAQTLVNAAKYLLSAPEAQRPAVWSQMQPQLSQKLGIELPIDYNDEVVQTAQSLVSSYGSTAATGVQSTYVDAQGNRVAILRDGSTQILGQNAPNNQIIDTGDGFYGVNKGNLGAAPVRIGGGQQQSPQAPQAGMYQTPQGVVRLGDDLSPEQREAAMADIAAGGGAGSVQLPDRGVSQPTGGGQQLRSAPKPQAPSELDRRLETAKAMGATPEQLKAIVMGSASPNGPTAAEQKDAMARKAKQPQVANAVRGIDRIRKALAGLSSGVPGTFGLVDTGPYDQYAVRSTKAGQELESAVGGIQNSLLSLTRVPGIGSQSDLEARIAAMQYPSLDKAPEVNASTLKNLEAFIADLQDAYRLADAAPQGPDAPESDDIGSLLDLYP